jgi:hypothetical protein
MESLQSARGFIGAMGFLGIIQTVLQVLLYISLIAVAFKTVQALNIYINNNSK